MKTTEEMIKVMEAHIAGKGIEFQSHVTNEWMLVPDPIWNWAEWDYRIKPEPREFSVVVNAAGTPIGVGLASDGVIAVEPRLGMVGSTVIKVREVL